MAQPKAPQVSFASAPTPPPVDTSTANLIRTVGNIGGQVVKSIQQGRLEKSFKDTAEAAKTVDEISKTITDAGGSQAQVNTALKQAVSFDPSKDAENTLDGIQLPDNVKKKLIEVKSRARDAFDTIAQAKEQGALTENAAALQLEATTRRLVNETPGFGNEIKSLARELAGYDPTNYDLQQVLKVSSTHAPLTATQKMSQNADAIVAGFGAAGIHMDKNVVLAHLARAEYGTALEKGLQSQLAVNDINFAQYAHQTMAERGIDVGQTLVGIAKLAHDNGGGITQPQDYVNLFIQQREADKQKLRQTAAEYNVSDTELNSALDAIDKQYAPTIQATKDNDLGKILAHRIDLSGKLSQLWGAKTLPNLTRLVQAFPNSHIPDQVIQMMATMTDPNQFNLLTSFDPGLKALVSSGLETPSSVSQKVTDSMMKIMTGQELSSEDMKFEPVAEKMVLGGRNNAETREKFIDGLGAKAPIRATSLLATSVPRNNATTGEVKYMKRQYGIYVGRPDGTENPTLVDQVAKDIPKDRLDSMSVEMQSKTITTGWDVQRGVPITEQREVPVIVIKTAHQLKGQKITTDLDSDALKRLQVFVNAAANGYGQDFGVNPKTFAQSLIDRIQTQVDMTGTIDRTAPKQ